jgi:uncharacterized protein (TIGR03067 family)
MASVTIVPVAHRSNGSINRIVTTFHGEPPMNALVALVAASLLVAADAKDDDIKKELEKLEGEWVVVENEKDGEKATAENIKGSGLTFKGDKLTMRDKGEEVGIAFKLDLSKKPKTIELTLGMNIVRGIYSLDGDTLKLCVHLGRPDSKFPTEFTGMKGYSLAVLKREKK